MTFRILHPASPEPVDVPLAIEAEGGAAIEAYVAAQLAAATVPAAEPAPADPSTPEV